MRIEDVINVMDDVSEILDLEGVHQAAAELYEAMKALEQHHKDLMGLVEAWTNKIGPATGSPYSSGQSDAFRKCRNDLSSLINPKD